MVGSLLPVSPPQTDPRIPIAAKDQAALEKYVGSCHSLGRYAAKDVLVVRGYSGDLQLWVSPTYSGYRNAWVSAFGPVVAAHDVDHVYSKKRGELYGYAYVRLALVDGKTNQRSGEFEALMGKVGKANEAFLGQPLQAQEIRYADDVQALKLKHLSFKPNQRYAETQKPGQAILSGTRLVGPTKPVTPQAQRVTVPLNAPRAVVAAKPLVTAKSWKPAPPKRSLQVTSVTLHRTATDVRVVPGAKSYAWSGAVVEWLMGALITAVNHKRTQEALDKILAGVEKHIPENGGVLIAVVYEQPDNAVQYGHSTELFLYAYVMGYGETALDAYLKYQEETSRPGYATLSPGARKSWAKVEHHVWVRLEEH